MSSEEVEDSRSRSFSAEDQVSAGLSLRPTRPTRPAKQLRSQELGQEVRRSQEQGLQFFRLQGSEEAMKAHSNIRPRQTEPFIASEAVTEGGSSHKRPPVS